MGLRDRFQYGNLFYDRFDPWGTSTPHMEWSESATGEERLTTESRQAQFAVSLRLSQNYWANKAQQRQAREAAERLLLETLYRDVAVQLSIIANFISSGDRHRALEAVLNLRKDLLEP